MLGAAMTVYDERHCSTGGKSTNEGSPSTAPEVALSPEKNCPTMMGSSAVTVKLDLLRNSMNCVPISRQSLVARVPVAQRLGAKTSDAFGGVLNWTRVPLGHWLAGQPATIFQKSPPACAGVAKPPEPTRSGWLCCAT